MIRLFAPAGCVLLSITQPLAAQQSTLPDWALKIERPTRRALVIGISSYDNARQLTTPVTDADKFEQTLKTLNFKTIDRAPGGGRTDRPSLLKAVSDFVAKLAPGDLAVVYYSGHGTQADGINYIVGSDGTANPPFPGLDWLSVDYVLGEIAKTKAAVAVIVLDACRADPFSGTGAEDRDILDPAAVPTISSGPQGLAPPGGPPSAYVIAFAAQPKMVAYSRFASDPPATSSIYTRTLTSRLARQAPLGRALAAVDNDVAVATGGRQTPMSSQSSVWDLPLDGAKPDSSPTEEEWGLVASTAPIAQLVQELSDFLVFHPLSDHAAAAREKLTQIASAQPSPPPAPGQPDPINRMQILLGTLQASRNIDGELTAVANAPVSVRARRNGGFDLGTLIPGTRVKLVKFKGNFARILAPDGRFGWVGGVKTADPARVRLDVRLSFAGADEYADAKDWTPLGNAARELSVASTAVTIRTGSGSVAQQAQARLVGRLRALRIRDYVIRLGVPAERVVILDNDAAVGADEAQISVLKVSS